MALITLRNTSDKSFKLFALLFLFFFLGLWANKGVAEGTKQWAPSASDNNYLKVNSSGTYTFGGYGLAEPKRLHIHIKDPDNEVVHMGFSRMVNEPANIDITTAYQFRIVSPSGSIVHGPHSVSTPNVTSHAMAVAGPNTISAGGYPVGGIWTFTPTTAGDHYIEFSTAGSIRWFDITVATTGASPTAIDGRIWSRAWTVRSDNGYTSIANAFDTPFNGSVTAYDGKYATKIDFQGAGLRPLEGQFSFNSIGTGNTGNKENDRKSVNGSNSGNPGHKIFLNLPDPSVYSLQPEGKLQNLPLKVSDPATPTIAIEVTQAGKIELLLNFGGGTKDRRLFADVIAGINQIPWDGNTGEGIAATPDNYPIPVYISYSQGETHFTAFDVEGLDNGFQVFTQTSSGTIGPRLQFWDDSNIPDIPGFSDSQINVDSGNVVRRRWNNSNYGDLNTINTWWYAYREAQSSTVLLPGDYGDAPSTYGSAVHKLIDTPTVYLGAIAPDEEPQSLTPADGTGDDADGSDDEDAFSGDLSAISVTDTSYSLNIRCTGEGSTVAGWVDFNSSGTFETVEKATSLCTSGISILTWSSISGMSVGTTYLRLRIASNAADVASPSTGASDGEVEDYSLEIAPLKPTAFVCDGKPYAVIGSPSNLQEMNKTTLAVANLGSFNPTIDYNGIGYNTLDNFIYGYANGNIYRVGYNREIEDLGVPTGSGIFNPDSHTGTMDTSGKFYGIDDDNIYIVNIGNNPIAGSLTFTSIPRSGTKTVTADIAFSAADGKLYGMRSNKLIQIDPTTGVGSIVSVIGDNLSGSADGAWSSADGGVYLYNSSQGRLFKVDTSTSSLTAFDLGAVASNNQFDATACIPPALTKGASVTETGLGQTFEYIFTIFNPATTAITVTVNDTLPSHLTFVTDSLSTATLSGGSVTTFSDTQLSIGGISVPGSGNVTFKVNVKVSLSAPEGNISNQASLLFGSNTYISDDPETGAIEDPTTVKVIHSFDYGDAPDSIDVFKYGQAKHIIVGSSALGLGKQKAQTETETEVQIWNNDWSSKMKGKHKGWFDNKFKKKDQKKNERVPIELTDGDGEEEDALLKGKFVWKKTDSCSGLMPDGTLGSVQMDSQTFCLEIEASNDSDVAAQLVAWLDFNNNGEFDDPSERSVVHVDADTSNDDTQGNVPAGSNGEKVVVYWDNFSEPTDEVSTFIRMRLTTDPEFKSDHSPDPLGIAIDGEVEDTAITLKPFSSLEIQTEHTF